MHYKLYKAKKSLVTALVVGAAVLGLGTANANANTAVSGSDSSSSIMIDGKDVPVSELLRDTAKTGNEAADHEMEMINNGEGQGLLASNPTTSADKDQDSSITQNDDQSTTSEPDSTIENNTDTKGNLTKEQQAQLKQLMAQAPALTDSQMSLFENNPAPTKEMGAVVTQLLDFYETNNKLGNVSKDRVDALKEKLAANTNSSAEMSKDLDITGIDGALDTPTAEMQTIMDGVKTEPDRYQVLTHRKTASGNMIDVYFDATSQLTFVKMTDQDGKASYIQLEKNKPVLVTANAGHTDWYMTNFGFKDGKPYILLTDKTEADWITSVLPKVAETLGLSDAMPALLTILPLLLNPVLLAPVFGALTGLSSIGFFWGLVGIPGFIPVAILIATLAGISASLVAVLSAVVLLIPGINLLWPVLSLFFGSFMLLVPLPWLGAGALLSLFVGWIVPTAPLFFVFGLLTFESVVASWFTPILAPLSLLASGILALFNGSKNKGLSSLAPNRYKLDLYDKVEGNITITFNNNTSKDIKLASGAIVKGHDHYTVTDSKQELGLSENSSKAEILNAVVKKFAIDGKTWNINLAEM